MNRAFRPIAFMLALAILALAHGGTAHAQSKDAPEKGVTIEGITEYRLKNGCKFLLFPDPASSKVTVNMTVMVGSRHEGYGETGMAHLLEHMLFKGTKGFLHIDKALQAHGATNANASTWTDRTNYFETMPATDENLEFGIKLEADRLVNSFIKREDLVKEMTVVRNEFEMGENTPEYILSQRMWSSAFLWHSYGKSTIGNRSDIERVPIENLQAFYKKFYQPDNIVVIVAGKFDPEKAIKLITENFGAIPAPTRKLAQTYTEEPTQDGERVVTLQRAGKVAVTGAVYHIPAAAHEDHPALEVLSTVLGDPASGRLYKALVEKKLATSASANAMAWFDPSLFEVMASVAEKVEPEKVRKIMLEVAEGLGEKPPTKEEVDRAKQRYLSAREQALTSSHSIATELSEWCGSGDWRLLFVYRDRVAKVTPEDVSRVAEKYLKPNNRTVGTFYPTDKPSRSPIPGAPDIAALVKDYKGGKALAEGEEFDPTPANLEKRIKRFTLSNGLKVAFLPKKTRGEVVVGQIVLRFGNEKSLTPVKDAAEYLGQLMMRGTKNRTNEQIKDDLDKINSKLSAGGGVGALTLTFQSKSPQLPQLLAILQDVVREPVFPVKEFDVIKNAAKQQVLEAMVDPQGVAFNHLRRQLSPYAKDNIRYVPSYAESLARLEKVTADDVRKVYEEQIGGQVGEIAFVGDFDPDAVKTQLEKIFAGWKTSVPYERIGKKVMPVKGKRDTLETPDKENAVYAAGHTFDAKDTDPDYAALVLGNYILGESGFTSRLMDRLRQKEGWSYGAGSVLQVESEDRLGALVVFAICNPDVIEKVDKAAIEEIAKMLKAGVSEEELAAAKKGYLQARTVSRGSDVRLAGMMQSGLYLGRTFDFQADVEKKIAALTVKDVNQALAAHIDPDRLVVVRAGDFTKKKDKK